MYEFLSDPFSAFVCVSVFIRVYFLGSGREYSIMVPMKGKSANGLSLPSICEQNKKRIWRRDSQTLLSNLISESSAVF